ncbi:MAG: histone deacetylase family protein [Thermodesulfobacteriota bacterium]
MFQIRRIYDEILPVNKEALRQIREIFWAQFKEAPKSDAKNIGEKLHNPFIQQFRSIIHVAETARRKVLGFALVHHDPDLRFCFLDYLAAAKWLTGGGIGGALYEKVREEAFDLGAKGLFFECLPDDPAECSDPRLLKENAARLRFYEHYGARPVVNTKYEMPIKPEDTCMPHFVYDALARKEPLRRAFARKVVKAILERKYSDLCPPAYVKSVVGSFREDPVRLREFKYIKPQKVQHRVIRKLRQKVALVVNDRHSFHHVHERGYVESPVRVRSILSKIVSSEMFDRIPPANFPDKHIREVHAPDFLAYLRLACEKISGNRSLYPYVFPIRNRMRPPKDRSVLAGYYCIDTFTPLNHTAYLAARRGVDCVLSAARQLIKGRAMAYALVRPPGHHAERRSFGGFCYFNNNAVAAQYLRTYGNVAILDVDYHHGNGQQDIFYDCPDVLTVSIHGHPRFAYPYFSGFEDELGSGPGMGYNINFPLPERQNGETYRRTLKKALRLIKDFQPEFLIVALGLDTAKDDPTGSWTLLAKDFAENGKLIGSFKIPILIVQEGGYLTKTLGVNVRNFFAGLVG